MPSHITAKIEDSEQAIKISSGGKTKSLPFSSLIELATDMRHKDSSVRPKAVMWASAPPDVYHSNAVQSSSPDPRYQHQESGSRRGPTFENQQEAFDYYESRQGNRSGDFKRGTGTPRCTHCRIPGHHRDECWRRSGSCLICGKSHFIESCPKYDSRYRSRSQSRGRDARPLN